MKNIKIAFLMLICLLFLGRSYSQILIPNYNTYITIGSETYNELPPDDDPLNPTGPTAPGDRLIYWLHGLGGDQTSWIKVANATQYNAGNNPADYPARKVFSISPRYAEFTLNDAAIDVNNSMIINGDGVANTNGITDHSKNFIIAHSQGGVVARNLDRLYNNNAIPTSDRRFGGVVTFGTANQGAQILNNKDMFTPFAAKACSEMAAGPVSEVAGSFIWALARKPINENKDKVCKFLSDKLVPSIFKDFSVPITEGYKVGATGITQINNTPSNTPMVAFYGVEEQPVMWRTMYNLIDNFEGKLPNEFPLFGAGDDDPFVHSAEVNRNESESKVQLYNQIANDHERNGWIFLLLNPTLSGLEFIKAKGARKQRDDWRITRNWWENANNDFELITGALTIGSPVPVDCECSNYDYGNLINTYRTGVADPIACNAMSTNTSTSSTDCFTIYSLDLVHNPSDGIVLAESASALPNAPSKEMIGSNHQQMRNDSNTKERLKELFKGDYGNYFITLPR